MKKFVTKTKKFADTYYVISLMLCGSLVFASIFTESKILTDRFVYPKWFFVTMVLFLMSSFYLYLYFRGRYIAIDTKWRSYLDIIICVICGFQGCFYLLQKITHVNCEHFFIAGSFDNIAGLSSCLSISLPIGLNILKRKDIETHTNNSFGTYKSINIIWWIICVSKISSILAIVVSKSRLGIICVLFTLAFGLGLKNNKKLITLLIVLLLSLFVVKTKSTNGRYFIYKQAIYMISEKPLTGWGTNGFRNQYMEVQANYFRRNVDSKFSNIADNIHHPLSDYLLVGVNYGVSMLTLLVITSIILLRIAFKNRYANPNLLCLTNIIIHSSFSYPFIYPFTWVMVIFVLLNMFSKTLIKVSGFALVVSASVVLSTPSLVNNYIKNLKWGIIADKGDKGMLGKILPQYDRLYPYFCENPFFLYNYSAILFECGLYSGSVKIAESCFEIYKDYDLCLLLGDTYMKLNKYSKAEEMYELAHDMVPSRITPLYRIFVLLFKQGKQRDAENIGKKILCHKEKINSDISIQIKKEVSNILNK